MDQIHTGAVTDAGLFTQHAPGVLAAIAVFAAGWVASRIVAWLLRRALEASGADPTLGGFCVSAARFGVLAIAGVSALEMAGIPSTSFLAVLGAAGLAIGLAMKGTLSHLASGVVLVTTRPFKVGDRVEVKGVVGKVEQVRLFTTLVRIDDGTNALIPNSDLVSNIIKITDGQQT